MHGPKHKTIKINYFSRLIKKIPSLLFIKLKVNQAYFLRQDVVVAETGYLLKI